MPTIAPAHLVLIGAPTSALFLPASTSAAPKVGHTFQLAPGKNLLGRDPGATVFLPWIYVSRRQAIIEFFAAGTWEIEDLQGRNGTYVNGTKLSAHTLTVLNEGDRIAIGMPGALELLFTFQPAPQATREEQYERFLEMDEFGNESCAD